MTLIVAAEDAQDAQAASEVLAELMHEHPSRAIVLKPSDEKGRAGRARVRTVLDAVRAPAADLLRAD